MLFMASIIISVVSSFATVEYAQCPVIFDKTNGVLTISLSSGERLTFEDSSHENYNPSEHYPNAYSYKAYGCISDRFLVLELSMDEFSEYKLIDIDNGNIIEIDGRPILSPARKHIITYRNDIDFGSFESIISIYESKRTNVTKVFSKNFGKMCGPINVIWLNDEAALFDIECMPPSPGEHLNYKIYLDDGIWKLNLKDGR